VGGAGGTGGSPADGGAVDAAATDAQAPGADAGTTDAPTMGAFNWATCMDFNQPGVNAAEFCMRYEAVCMFGGANRYTSTADCMMKYNMAAAAVKSCRAGHLCVAGKMAPATHCPHAAGIGACM
jgi:hypothetical protein